MLTCLCDAFYGEVGIAAVRVLEHAGCTVEFDQRSQTCCGQPPFNAGDWTAAREIAGRTRLLFSGETPVVTPSGSCAAMIRHGYTMLFPNSEATSCFELCEFLVDVLGVTKWPLGGSYSLPGRKIALHRACHHRSLACAPATASAHPNAQELLLSSMLGVELQTFADPEQCCGFGGAFAATHGKISSEIGLEKLRKVAASGAELLVSGDMGCLMHLNGLIERERLDLRTAHIAEVLAEPLG